jgi:hypothetical protein
MHVCGVRDVARVEPVPAVAGGRDCTIAPINFVEVKARVRFHPRHAFLDHSARPINSSPSVRQPGLIRAMVRMRVTYGPTDATPM